MYYHLAHIFTSKAPTHPLLTLLFTSGQYEPPPPLPTLTPQANYLMNEDNRLICKCWDQK